MKVKSEVSPFYKGSLVSSVRPKLTKGKWSERSVDEVEGLRVAERLRECV